MGASYEMDHSAQVSAAWLPISNRSITYSTLSRLRQAAGVVGPPLSPARGPVRLGTMATRRIPATKRAKRRPPARTGRPPGQSREQTRKNILLAARECFARLGFERATNRDIASAAGVTAAAMYRYFDSKPELYIAVVRDASAQLVPRLRAAIASQAGSRASLRELIVQRASALDRNQLQAIRFLSAIPLEMQRHPEVAQRMLADPGEVYVLINELVTAGVRSKEIPRDKPDRVVAMTIAVLMGLSMYANTLGEEAGKLAFEGFIDLFDGRLFNRTRGSRSD
jgi:AcrR family transcriptional regulator